MSLRHKLILLLAVMTLAAVAITVATAYEDVRQASLMAADERLARVADRLAARAQSATADRADRLAEAGTAPALRDVLVGAPPDTAAVLAALAALRSDSDSGLAIRLVDRDGRVVFTDLPEASPLPARPLPLDTIPTYGNLRRVGERVHYLSTGPVRAGNGEIVGWAVQERRLGSPGSASQLLDLIGADAHVSYAIPGEEVAASLAGEPVAVPPDAVRVDSILRIEHGGATYLARAADIPNTPWVILVEIPLSAVEARGAAFLGRMTVLALLLVLATITVAYLLGHRLTGPIDRLVVATEAVALGRYDGEIKVPRGGDELDRLARSFNDMAERVSSTRAELEERLSHEQALSRELEEARSRAEAARQEAQEANRAKAQFLATMSHEVRTPINAVLGYCDLLDMEISGPLTPKQREKVERIRRSSRVLGSLVEDVLDFAKIDTGQLRLDLTTAPLRKSVLEAAAFLEPAARRGGLSIDVDIDPELTFIGDVGRVEQILVNLLSNAVKFTDQGGVRLHATPVEGDGPFRRDGESDGAWVKLDVADTGPGIPEGKLGDVFEPFVQGDTGYTRRHGGTGLGLSISRELALRMGGDLTVRSAVGEGSCFTLWLRSGGENGSSA